MKMKIGITCYPTYGGSGVVATELGKELAHRGHSIHFISYALPMRLSGFQDNIVYHEVEMANYPVFEFPLYTLALASKMVEVARYEKLDILHCHYALPHATSAYLAKQILHDTNLKIVTTLHGTDITLVGLEPSFLPIMKFSIEQSDGVTAVSRFLKEKTQTNYGIDKDIAVIPNFIDTAKYKRTPSDIFCVKSGADGQKVVAHTSNFRPVKRVADVIRIFNEVQKKYPAYFFSSATVPTARNAKFSAANWALKTKCDFSASRWKLSLFSQLQICSSCRANRKVSALPRLKRWHAKSPLYRPASADCRNCRYTDRQVLLRKSATSSAWLAMPSTCFPIRSSIKCSPKLPGNVQRNSNRQRSFRNMKVITRRSYRRLKQECLFPPYRKLAAYHLSIAVTGGDISSINHRAISASVFSVFLPIALNSLPAPSCGQNIRRWHSVNRQRRPYTDLLRFLFYLYPLITTGKPFDPVKNCPPRATKF